MTNWKDELSKLVDLKELLAINIEGKLYKKGNLDVAIERLKQEFDSGYGLQEGVSFWAWSKTLIYFCGLYDGAEWLETIPQRPSEGIPSHIGGQ